MKELLSFFIGLLIFTSALPLKAQKLISNSSVTGVCYAGNKIKRVYIPPPDVFYKKSGLKGGAINNGQLFWFFQPGQNSNGLCCFHLGIHASG